MSLPCYEVLAVKYATRDGRRYANFLGGDPHDAPMPMDYFLWVARNAARTIVIDTGFTAQTATRRKRDYLRTPAEALALVGVDAAPVRDVVITHMHYDHLGGYGWFPGAKFHVQDLEMRYATGRYMLHPRFNHGYDVEDIEGMIRLVFADRVTFHKGEAELAPGLSIHRIGGHTAGMQCVRVHTARGSRSPPRKRDRPHRLSRRALGRGPRPDGPPRGRRHRRDGPSADRICGARVGTRALRAHQGCRGLSPRGSAARSRHP